MKLIVQFFIVLTFILSTQGLSCDKDRFTVVAPTKIRQGEPFNVHIRGFSVSKTICLVITINGTCENGNKVNIKKTAKISRDSLKASLSIDTSSIKKGNYSLFVEGGNVFEKRTLIYDTKKFSILILLNKSPISPGDLLQYKFYVIDTETKPANSVCKCSVSISDPNKNVVFDFKNLEFKNGRYFGQLNLPSTAKTGKWNIRAKCDGGSASKNFEVKELNPSILLAKVTVEDRVLYSSRKVPITLEASYGLGRLAYGKATVIITTNKITYTKEVFIDDESVTFMVDLIHNLKIERNDEPRCDVELVFYDYLMNNATYKTRFIVVLVAYKYIIEKKYEKYTPGKSYPFKITLINDYTRKPAPAGTKVQVRFENPDLFPSFTLTLDDNGSASSSVFVPKGFKDPLEINFVAKDAFAGSIIAYRKGSNPYDKPFLNVAVLDKNENLSLGDRVQVKITSAFPTPFVMLHIISKGVLLKSTIVWFDEDSSEKDESNTVIYSFSVSPKHIPGCFVVAYYIDKNGTFVVGDTFVSLRLFNNYLKLMPKENEVKPGGILELDIESRKNSIVSLVAFDQRYFVSRGDSIITTDEVFNWILDFQNTAIFDWDNIATYERFFGYSGLYIFTNIPRPQGGSRSLASATPSSAPSDNNDAETNGFSEGAFLWLDVDIGSSGLETIRETVPNTLTSYIIYGISSNECYGIGLPEKSTTINVFKPFSISAEFPYSIKRNQVHIQNIVLFNYVAKGLNVEVKIKKNSKFDGVNFEENGWEDSGEYYVQSIVSRSGIHFRLDFALRPKVTGFITFEVAAKGPLVADKIKKQIRVVSG